MNNKISIVIPVYNVEKYICECLDSVINQTYKNLQIILVDDGSTDSSGVICDGYAQKDSRISVVHQSNAGAGSAKNVGLDLVNGDCFMFLDSDDYIELNMIEYMLNMINTNQVDIVQCDLNNVYVNKKITNKIINTKNYNKILNADEYLLNLIYDYRYSLLFNKLYKTELLSDIRFPTGRKIDDEFFTYRIICNAKKVFVSDMVFHNYRQRKSSVMNVNKQDRLIDDRVDCFIERYEFIKNNRSNLSKKFYEHLSDILLLYRGQVESEELKNKINELTEVYPYYKPNIFKRLKNRNLKKNNYGEKESLIFFD